jgi:YD repeat-containing protein
LQQQAIVTFQIYLTLTTGIEFMKKAILTICALVLSAPALATTWVPIQVGDITTFVPLRKAIAGPIIEEYQYDSIGRLKEVKENGTVKAGYTYDDADNRKTKDEN